jgi:hypothetical protein
MQLSGTATPQTYSVPWRLNLVGNEPADSHCRSLSLAQEIENISAVYWEWLSRLIDWLNG